MPRVLLFEFLLQPFSSHRLRAAQQPAVLQSVSLVGLPPVADRILLVVAVLLGPSPARRRGPFELPQFLPFSPPCARLCLLFAAVPQRPPVAEPDCCLFLRCLLLEPQRTTRFSRKAVAHERVRMKRNTVPQTKDQRPRVISCEFTPRQLLEFGGGGRVPSAGQLLHQRPLQLRTTVHTHHRFAQSGNAPR